FPREPGLPDHLAGLLLCVSYVALLAATSFGLGMTRDEVFYVQAADQYGAWFELLVADPAAALTQENIDRYWQHNREHPPLIKTAFAVSSSLHRHYDIFPIPSLSYRFPGMLCAGLLLWLTYIFGVRVAGRTVGAAAACVLACLP